MTTYESSNVLQGKQAFHLAPVCQTPRGVRLMACLARMISVASSVVGTRTLINIQATRTPSRKKNSPNRANMQTMDANLVIGQGGQPHHCHS